MVHNFQSFRSLLKMCNKITKRESTPKREKTPKRRRNKACKILRGIMSNITNHIFLFLRTIFDMTVDLVFGFFWDGTKQQIPALEKRHALLAESAVDLAAKIRNREIKSQDLVQICIERIKQVNPILNAVTDERYDNALKDAREVDNMIEIGLNDDYFKQKPFLGVPFTAKESHAVAGMLHTLGISGRKHIRVVEDAECVRLLRDSGAIPVAVTNVPEINKWQETRNMVFGQTNNPYHTGRTTGGSSGGEAALSAALASPISLCSDIGGSTRMPAFYCGLFGLNPTAGHTSLKGSALRSGLDPTMAAIGFVSKHVKDLSPLTKVVAGDQASLLQLDRQVNVKDLKFFYTETAQDLRVSPICSDLRKAMNDVIQKLSSLAATTDKAPKPYYHRGFDHMFNIWKHAMTKENDNFAKMLMNNQGEANGIIELLRKMVGMSPFTLAAILKLLDDQVMPKVDKEWAETITDELKDDIVKTLGTDGVLIFPSAPTPAPYHYSLLLKPFHFSYWGVFNALLLPSAQVPLGLNSEGLPVGIQVIAGPRQDALCLAVAEYLGSYVPPCKVL